MWRGVAGGRGGRGEQQVGESDTNRETRVGLQRVVIREVIVKNSSYSLIGLLYPRTHVDLVRRIESG